MAVAVSDPPVQIVSTDDAVELIWERVLAGDFDNVHEAARELWPSLRFSPVDLSFLGLYGLIQLSTDRQRETRRASTSRPAVGYGSPHGKKWDAYIALTWPYESADGSQKSLLDFTVDDLSAFAQINGVMVQAYRRRQDWAVDTSRVLTEHGKTIVRELPAAVLARVNEAALEAMGRQQ